MEKSTFYALLICAALPVAFVLLARFLPFLLIVFLVVMLCSASNSDHHCGPGGSADGM